MFQAAKPTKVFQDVVAQIEDAILTGRIATGQVLPSERELKEMLHVSRGTLREALRVLEQKGLIEIRLGVGGGSVVRSVGTGQVSESLALLIRSQQVSLNHLAEFREDVEGCVTARAAERRSVADLAKLKKMLARAHDCAQAGVRLRSEFLEADKQIHMLLAQITGNPLFKTILVSIHDNIHRYYDRFLSMDEREMEENCGDLREIVHAVEGQDRARARAAAEAHVRRFNRYMADRERREQNATEPSRARISARGRRPEKT